MAARIAAGLSAFVALALTCTTSAAASFDCSQKLRPIEKLICGDVVLSRLDEQLAEAYRAARVSARDRAGLLREQRHWVVTRDACKDGACLRRSYVGRIRELDEAQRPKCDGLTGLKSAEPCLHDRLQRIERRVAEAYEHAVKIVDQPETVKEAQDYWETVRNENCEVRTTDAEQRIQCRIASAEERLAQLDDMLNGNCAKYGLRCVSPSK